MFRSVPLAVVLLLLALAGCGGEDRVDSPQAETPSPTESGAGTEPAEPETEASEGSGEANLAARPPGSAGLRVAAKRARIVARASDFGEVLFDANGQVVYVFEIDARNRSNCTSEECVQAWPPVLTESTPSAGAGLDGGLLGTIRRADGRRQVTYGGRPLYFYEHEGPGEIKCHNVNLHGGLWWVVTPRGDPVG